VKVSTPVMKPTMSLALRLAKKEPWPQSWKTMKVRTMKPAVGMASSTVSQ
jgi:hypothetical protein